MAADNFGNHGIVIDRIVGVENVGMINEPALHFPFDLENEFLAVVIRFLLRSESGRLKRSL